jgi:hypothetical protein
MAVADDRKRHPARFADRLEQPLDGLLLRQPPDIQEDQTLRVPV